MRTRLVLHIVLCLFLAAIGWWFYLQLSDDNNSFYSSINIATYWFWLLVFFLFSWIFYWFVRWKPVKAWVISLSIVLVISFTSTTMLRVISYKHDQERLQLEKELEEGGELQQILPESEIE